LEIALLIGVSLIHKLVCGVPPIGPYIILASLDTYGANVTQIKAPIGGTVPFVDIEKALQEKKYKILTFTHVDTSTGMIPPDR
jgi:selenocysteine lyase/cysteine desulfurase